MAFRRYANAPPDPDWLEPVDHGRAAVTCGRDPIYLFACHLEWRDRGNLPAYHELTAALDDTDRAFGVSQRRCCADRLDGKLAKKLSRHGEGALPW